MRDLTRGLRARLNRLEKTQPVTPAVSDWINFDDPPTPEEDPDLYTCVPITDPAAERIAELEAGLIEYGLKELPVSEQA
jgi:hypothetical protein